MHKSRILAYKTYALLGLYFSQRQIRLVQNLDLCISASISILKKMFFPLKRTEAYFQKKHDEEMAKRYTTQLDLDSHSSTTPAAVSNTCEACSVGQVEVGNTAPNLDIPGAGNNSQQKLSLSI